MGRKVTDEQVAKVKEVQESVEKLLEGNTFIAGDKLTVADYSYVTVMDALEVLLYVLFWNLSKTYVFNLMLAKNAVINSVFL